MQGEREELPHTRRQGTHIEDRMGPGQTDLATAAQKRRLGTDWSVPFLRADETILVPSVYGRTGEGAGLTVGGGDTLGATGFQGDLDGVCRHSHGRAGFPGSGEGPTANGGLQPNSLGRFGRFGVGQTEAEERLSQGD